MGTTHRGRRTKADAVRQKALAAIEKGRQRGPFGLPIQAPEPAEDILKYFEVAGLRIVERKSP